MTVKQKLQELISQNMQGKNLPMKKKMKLSSAVANARKGYFVGKRMLPHCAKRWRKK